MTTAPKDTSDASRRIDARIDELRDWRGDVLARVRALIHDADPDVVEDVKWVKPTNPHGVPTWSHNGLVCTGEVYKAYVKLTFAHGAKLDDPDDLFNASLDGGTRRAIDVRERDVLDSAAFKALFLRAVTFNKAKKAKA
ncbi:DUF1801 domain-containing protein [Pseudoxanthomonas sp. LjRoot125]|uniref:DUF1801 domain-containing protein n=1 Tax=Pseudoxanthomonas sp. LjRoot125 TaxID=3342258 RepID=UPI003E11C443